MQNSHVQGGERLGGRGDGPNFETSTFVGPQAPTQALD